MNYRGWIAGDIRDAQLLRDMGIKLGKYNHDESYWEDCIVSDEQLIKLDPHWGCFTWGLKEFQ